MTIILRSLVPLKVLEESKLSLDLLFPFWDSRTIELLAKERQNFHEYGPFESIGILTLLDFDHWRDRLLELHEEVFLAPPVSWAQLWRDRRNPQQFWTFWIALMILLLTVTSTVATIVQAWASIKALRRVSWCGCSSLIRQSLNVNNLYRSMLNLQSTKRVCLTVCFPRRQGPRNLQT